VACISTDRAYSGGGFLGNSTSIRTLCPTIPGITCNSLPDASITTRSATLATSTVTECVPKGVPKPHDHSLVFPKVAGQNSPVWNDNLPAQVRDGDVSGS
jgi:hypothetical protein